MANTVKVRDRGLRDLKKRLKKSGQSFVKVGIFGEEADATHAGTKRSNVEIAGFHEFGTGTIPQRSFLRATVDAEEGKIKKLQRTISRNMLKRRITEKKGLGLIGTFVTGEIQKRIRGGIDPKLKPATIRRKGSSKQLIDTGQLVQSITWEVVRGRLPA